MIYSYYAEYSFRNKTGIDAPNTDKKLPKMHVSTSLANNVLAITSVF